MTTRKACQFWVMRWKDYWKSSPPPCRHTPTGVYEWTDGESYPLCDYHLGIMNIVDPRYKYKREFEIWPGTEEEWEYWMDESEESHFQYIFEIFPDKDVLDSWSSELNWSRKLSKKQAKKFVDQLTYRFGEEMERPVSVQVLIDKGIEIGLYKKRPRGQFLLNVAWKAGLIRKFVRHRAFKLVQSSMDHRSYRHKRTTLSSDKITKGGRNIGVHYQLTEPSPQKAEEIQQVIESVYFRRYRESEW